MKKRILFANVLLSVSLLMSGTSFASGQIADAGDMTDVEEVVKDWMQPVDASQIEDGAYEITVDSSSSMFSIENCLLTVEDGQMEAAMTMGGTGYLYVFMGTPEEAVAADEAEYIPFEEDENGAHIFTVPVEALDMGQKCAAFSKKKEKWYDRTLVFRADSLPADALKGSYYITAEDLGLEDGVYLADVALSGGSGKASVDSPARITVEDGACTAMIQWSSSNYDYMIAGDVKYEPLNDELGIDGGSVFRIPVTTFDKPMYVSADTTAMSVPHEISYTLTFDSASVVSE